MSEIDVEQVVSSHEMVARQSQSDATSTGEFKIAYNAGEHLDIAWVQRQFRANDFLDRDVTTVQVVGLVQEINRVFLANGYVNSGLLIIEHASVQNKNRLKLKLVSGAIEPPLNSKIPFSLTWTNNKAKGLRAAYIAERVPSAGQMPFNARDFERDFRILAADPAIVRLNANLSPGAKPGEALLHLEVTPQNRFDLYSAISNSQSPTVGGVRAAIGGTVRNAVMAGDVFTGEIGVTEGLNDARIDYDVPVLKGLSFNINASTNDANIVDPSLRPLDITSKGWNIEAGLTGLVYDRPLLPNGKGGWNDARRISIGAHIARKEADTTLLGFPFSFSPGAVDGHSAVTVGRLSGEWVERGDRQVWATSIVGTFGLEGTGSDIAGVDKPDENFIATLGQVSYARKLGSSGLEVRGRIAGQWTNSTLYSSERLAIGGQSTVRGYRENLYLADTGAIASAEINRDFDIGRGKFGAGSSDWGLMNASVFVDGATFSNQKGRDFEEDSIASAGVSLTWKPSSALQAKVTYAAELTDVKIFGKHDLQDDGIQFQVVFRPLEVLFHS